MGEAANQGAGIGGSSMAVGSLQAAGNSSNSQFSSFAPSSGGQILNSINNIGASGISGGLSSNGQAAKRSLPGQADFFEDQRQYLKIEEKRFKSLLDLMLKYREWEEERIKLQLMQGSSAGGAGNQGANQKGEDGENAAGANSKAANLPNVEHSGVSSAQ